MYAGVLEVGVGACVAEHVEVYGVASENAFSAHAGGLGSLDAGRAAVHKEVVAACISSKIPQLYATPRDIVMAHGMQEPPGRGKDQLEQNVMQDRA